MKLNYWWNDSRVHYDFSEVSGKRSVLGTFLSPCNLTEQLLICLLQKTFKLLCSFSAAQDTSFYKE